MTTTDIQVKGLAELQRYLNALPAKIEANVLRGALRAGAKEIEAAAKSYVSVSEPSSTNKKRYGGFAGQLRKSIYVRTRSKKGVVTATIQAGRGNAYYAQFVEYGTQQHWIKASERPMRNTRRGKRSMSIRTMNRIASRGGSLQIGKSFVGQAVIHPGAQPKPFMRPAMDNRARAAVLAAGAYIKKRLSTAHGIDTADIQLEADA